MGRTKFAELENNTKSGHFLTGYDDLYLYGSPGAGKSHILAALVCKLIREGKRVVYIPNCHDLLQDFRWSMELALCCAFYDDPESLRAIQSAPGVEYLLSFWRNTGDKYLVVDQLNALETASNSSFFDNERRWLNKLKDMHCYIYGASANEMSDRDVETSA